MTASTTTKDSQLEKEPPEAAQTSCQEPSPVRAVEHRPSSASVVGKAPVLVSPEQPHPFLPSPKSGCSGFRIGLTPYFQVLRNVSFPLLQCFFFFLRLFQGKCFLLSIKKKSELLLLISLESFAVISKLPKATCSHYLWTCTVLVSREGGGGGGGGN